MEHPTWEQLVDYAEGRLKGSEAATVTAHLGTCPSCTPDVAWLRETIRHLSDASLPAPPQAARVAVHAAFAHHRQARFEPPKRAWFPLPLARWAAIVVLAALAIVLLWSRSNSPALVAAVAETSGSVSVVRTGSAPQAVRPNLRLASGDRLLTGDDGRTRLAFGNEAVALTISPSSDVNIEEILFRDGRLEQLVARLDTGSLDVVVRGPGEFVLSTPAAVLKSHEGTFQVRTLAVDSLTLQVTTGEIEAITGAGAALMRSGEAVVLHADLPPGVSGPTPTPTAMVTPVATATPPASATTPPTPTATAAPTLTAIPTEGPVISATEAPSVPPAATAGPGDDQHEENQREGSNNEVDQHEEDQREDDHQQQQEEDRHNDDHNNEDEQRDEVGQDEEDQHHDAEDSGDAQDQHEHDNQDDREQEDRQHEDIRAADVGNASTVVPHSEAGK